MMISAYYIEVNNSRIKTSAHILILIYLQKTDVITIQFTSFSDNNNIMWLHFIEKGNENRK